MSAIGCVEFQIDTQGRDLELRCFRDIDGREGDFVITERRQSIAMVECRLSEMACPPACAT